LVHEAYVKLAGSKRLGWRDREHFLAMASRVMRQVLVDRARSRGALKRGGERRRTTLTGQTIPVDDQARALLELEDALQQLATVSPRLVQVVECRFFGGMSEVEIAAALGVTDRTVRRDWDKARLLLRSALEGVSATEGSET
jgi:RNA polymerase sigma factor (TIGR02999 family)